MRLGDATGARRLLIAVAIIVSVFGVPATAGGTAAMWRCRRHCKAHLAAAGEATAEVTHPVRTNESRPAGAGGGAGRRRHRLHDQISRHDGLSEAELGQERR